MQSRKNTSKITSRRTALIKKNGKAERRLTARTDGAIWERKVRLFEVTS